MTGWGPADLDKIGELRIKICGWPRGASRPELRIDQADPIILVSAKLLVQLTDPHHHPAATVVGDLLTVQARNRTVIYRIGEYVTDQDSYVCRWPD